MRLVTVLAKVPRYFDAGHLKCGAMNNDQIRPAWRGFMLLVLRLGIYPLVRGVLPSPIITFEDHGFRDRFLGLTPDCKPLLEKGSCSAVALMEALIGNEVIPGVPIEAVVANYETARRSRRKRKTNSFTPQDVQELVNGAPLVLEGIPISNEWAQLESPLPDAAWMKWIQWYFGVNIVSFFQWGTLFPVLLRIAREASDPVAKNALGQAIAIDKSVLGLSWAIRRLEEAASRNDNAFMREIGEALTIATVPKKLKAEALDFFLCIFDQWLSGLPLVEQAALLREGGLTVSVKALRNRRSRLGLPRVNRSYEVEIPEGLQSLFSRQRTYSNEKL